MAKNLTVVFRDVNGQTGRTRFWCNNEAEAALALQNLKNLSNAQVVGAYMAQPIDISSLAGNTASNGNVETARAKAKVRMRGADSGSVAAKIAYVTFEIPAPLGSLINGLVGDPANNLLTPFINKVHSTSGVTMTAIDKVFYARAR
jgi:hypothetical protein